MGDEDAAVVAADTLGRDMVEGVLDVVRQVPGWESLTEHQQHVHIDRIDKRVRLLVTSALGVIFKGDYPACTAQLLTVTFGSSIKAKIEIAKTAAARHELSDAAGQAVVVVMADPERYFDRMKDIRGSVDQKDLFHDPGQPLGHMGSETPPPPPPDEGQALDDALPSATPEEPPLNIPEEITDTALIALLEQCGMKPPQDGEFPVDAVPMHTWTPEQRIEAYVWGLAFRNFRAEGKPTPEVPAFLRWTIPQVPEAAETSQTAPVVGMDLAATPSQERTVIKLADDEPETLIKALELRRIHVTSKTVKRWSSSQRVAARAWLEGRTEHRPDFLPLPKVPAPGQEDAT